MAIVDSIDDDARPPCLHVRNGSLIVALAFSFIGG